jgi:hypothetical protein
LVIKDRPTNGPPTLLRIESIKKGAGATILVGEKAMDPTIYNTGGWQHDEPVFSGGSRGTGRAGQSLIRDGRNSFASNWGAAHVDGPRFVFADGSVRVLKYGTSENIVDWLMQPVNSRLVSGWE